MAVVPRKYCSYIKYNLLNQSLVTKFIFEIWEDPELDIKNSPYGSLRSNYLKYFKNDLIEEGFKQFYTKDDIFEEFYTGIKIPENLQTIDSYQNWLGTLSSTIIETIKFKKELNNNFNINLI
jgi:hypothetical protein